ncbi:MAG: PQQ-binding-like beta-propeller repeat protein [Planctomycetaceae bacterium]|nr:PQQ-binding-like beta-propeller repeat protein [Planctomycetaceae bacterium]
MTLIQLARETSSIDVRWRYLHFNARIVAFLVFTFWGQQRLQADDWPQFQGVMRDNKSSEAGLLTSWPEAGPKLAWSFDNAGIGYSSPAVVDDRIYLTGGRNGQAELFCLDANDGKELWSLGLNEKSFDFEGNAWGAGPRAGVTVDGERVYALAGDGQLVCASTDGVLKWQLNMVRDLGGSVKSVDAGEPKTLGWGFCWGPLVDGDHLICTPGSTDGSGLVVALDKANGKEVWRSQELNEESTYASPIIAILNGVRQYVVMTQFGIASVAPENGKLLWYYERSRPYSDVVIPTPVCHEDYVYASTGDGCDMIKISKAEDGKYTAEKVYSNRNMKNSIGGFVLHDNHIFGTSERRGWVCQDFMTGKIAWYQRANKSVGDGSLILADGQLYLYGEKTSEVSLIEASTEKWLQKGRFALPKSSQNIPASGKNWTRPVIADGKLYLRDQELLFCYQIQ